jgi:VWFA-related protein
MRSHEIVGCIAVLAFCVAQAQGQGQASTGPSSEPKAIQSRANEVLLDVVVRDKKGHLVSDLKPADFRVFDNGVEKKIASFRLVQGGDAIASGGVRTHLDPLQQVRLVTLIFQCWSPDARRLARDGSFDMLKGELSQNEYMAVMTIDHKLEVLQAYTNDLGLLRKAIDSATRSEVKDHSADTTVVQKQLQDMLAANPPSSQNLEEQVSNEKASLNTRGAAAPGASLANIAMAEIVLQMLQTQQASAATESGRIDIYALLDAVREQYRLPGRKTVLYFREGGFMIPQGMEQPFKNVISIANRANVSFYSIDARGLSTGSLNTDAMTALNNAAQASQRQFNDTGQSMGAGEEAQRAKSQDVALESTRSNTQNTLANLAESTGGSLIANTNDLRGPLHRVEEDVETYYEIAYAPEISNYDGSFHTISLKTSSTDLHVQSRLGYFALPASLANATGGLTAYEVPLLSALSAPQLPHDFDFKSTAMHYRGQQNQPVCVLAIDVPLGHLTFQPKGKEEYEGRLSYVAIVKNEGGEVVKKFRNEIPLNVPSGKMEALKVSDFIYTDHFDIAPGKYEVETAVLDGGNGNKISARKSSFVISSSTTQLAISSVSFVRDMKDTRESSETNDPLVVSGKTVSPSLDPVVVKATNAGLPFYLVAYEDKTVSVAPKLTMEFSKDGQVLGQASPDIGPPRSDGRIQYVGTLPAASLDPGNYTIRFILQQGTESAEESASFTVQ